MREGVAGEEGGQEEGRGEEKERACGGKVNAHHASSWTATPAHDPRNTPSQN